MSNHVISAGLGFTVLDDKTVYIADSFYQKVSKGRGVYVSTVLTTTGRVFNVCDTKLVGSIECLNRPSLMQRFRQLLHL